MSEAAVSLPVATGDRSQVQSLERAFALLEILAREGSQSLLALHESSGLPSATVYRLVNTLLKLGYVRKDGLRRYSLGPGLIPLGETASRAVAGSYRSYLRRVADELGESANLAIFDGEMVVYVAQAQSTRSMRMFTEVGRRVLPHATAVGKVLLSSMEPVRRSRLIERMSFPRYTDRTIVTAEAFRESLERAEADGFALDDGEQEVGVRCVAVAVTPGGLQPPFAISVSGPTERMSDDFISQAVPVLHAVRDEIERGGG